MLRTSSRKGYYPSEGTDGVFGKAIAYDVKKSFLGEGGGTRRSSFVVDKREGRPMTQASKDRKSGGT